MRILIADDENDISEILDFLARDKFSGKNEVFIAKNSSEAIDLIKTQQINFCISDHNMPGGNGNEILHYIIANNLKIPFTLCSTVTPQDMPKEYPIENIYFHIQKPDIVKGMKALAQFVNSQSTEIQGIYDLEHEFIPVSLNFLILLEKAPSDLYIRITDTKYLKCINGGDAFTIEDNGKYLSKSVTKLYVKKPSNEELIVNLINVAITKIMKKKDIPLNEKMAHVHGQIFDLIKFIGMSEELSNITKNNINETVGIILKNEIAKDFWKKLNLVGEYPSQLYTLHSMLASVIVKKLDWSSEATMFKLTLAAFFQDVTLNSLTVMKIADHNHFLNIHDTLSSKEIKNFLEHPTAANELIKTFKEIPPDIDKLILEQHEMPDGTGFPRKLNSNQLGPLSCLFILSGLLARFILSEGENFKMINFINKYEEFGYNKGNFKESFNIIKNM